MCTIILVIFFVSTLQGKVYVYNFKYITITTFLHLSLIFIKVCLCLHYACIIYEEKGCVDEQIKDT